VGEIFFVPPSLDPVKFRCLPTIRAVKFCPPKLDPVVVGVP